MEPTTKELTCPACGAKAVVRLIPGAPTHRWHCPHCHKLQTTEGPAADAAPDCAAPG
jgi:transposase-like protein